jgi:hypothetical protein
MSLAADIRMRRPTPLASTRFAGLYARTERIPVLKAGYASNMAILNIANDTRYDVLLVRQ